MMSSLGNASLILSSNNTGLNQGLNSGTSQIQSFVSNAKGILSSAFSSLGGIAAFGGIGAAIGGTIAAVSNGFSRLQDVGRQNKEAMSLGIDSEQYQGLVQILGRAGVAADEAGNFFGSMDAKLERAARTGRGPVAAALQNMGVDLQEIMNLPSDQRLEALADGFQRLGPGAQASAAAMSIFGSTALLPQLQQGRAGLQSTIEELKASGAILSASEAQAAQEASKAWTVAKRTLTQAWDSVSLSVATALTPLVKVAADVFKSIVEFARPVLSGIGEFFTTVSDIASPLITMIADGFKEMIQWVQQFGSSIGITFPSVRDITIAVFRAIGVSGAYVWDTLKAGVGGFTVSLSFVVEAVGHVADAIARMLGLAETGITMTGRNMRNWGTQAVLSWGESAGAVNRYFDNLRGRQAAAAAAPLSPRVNPAAEAPGDAKYEGLKALLQGSQEAYSVQLYTQFVNENGPERDNQQRAADGIEEVAAILRERLPTDRDSGNTLTAV
jgi:hypothetical protein